MTHVRKRDLHVNEHRVVRLISALIVTKVRYKRHPNRTIKTNPRRDRHRRHRLPMLTSESRDHESRHLGTDATLAANHDAHSNAYLFS